MMSTNTDTQQNNTEKAIFACGCFWSKEFLLSQQAGVLATQVGYTGGHVSHPTYKQVCSKSTGHAEAVEVTFDPQLTSFEQLARFFFEIHDPTVDRSGNGGQYRSAIFYQNERQKQTAEKLVQLLEANGYAVKTQLEKADTFWKAEDRHQKYCEVRGFSPNDYRKNRFTEKAEISA